jgi:DinB superfamily
VEDGMIDAKDLIGAFARNTSVVKTQAEGISHGESLTPQPNGNCLNWLVGHIVLSRDDILEELGKPRAAGAIVDRYQRGSEPITGEGEGVLPLSQLLELLDQSQERLEATLSQMDAAALDAKAEGDPRGRSVGQVAFFYYFHDTYHVGQAELFRQLVGRNDKLI